MNLLIKFVLAVAAGTIIGTSGCAVGNVIASKVPSISSRAVKKWAYADFVRDVEQQEADLAVANASRARQEYETELLAPFLTPMSEFLNEIRKLARSTDEVVEFSDTLDGRVFYCLKRSGYIIKTRVLPK